MEEAVSSTGRPWNQHDAWFGRDSACRLPPHCHLRAFTQTATRGRTFSSTASGQLHCEDLLLLRSASAPQATLTFKLASTNNSDKSHCQENNTSLWTAGTGGGGQRSAALPRPAPPTEATTPVSAVFYATWLHRLKYCVFLLQGMCRFNCKSFYCK